MVTIAAQVNTRLLTKADRLFTGTLAGRIIEILQNARRAGAQHVMITNRKGLVTVRDDGRGIKDFQALLDLGGSGWDPHLEASEDPAGVGLFCLAPRKLTIRSRGQRIVLDEQGWTGAPVIVERDRPLLACGPHIPAGVGTELTSADEPWEAAAVQPRAVFAGLEVTVDKEPCPQEHFIRGKAAEHPELGCRIQVVPATSLTAWHRAAALSPLYDHNVRLNFHGQVVAFSYHPVSRHDLHFLVDMTGQTTGIRLMLPARTCLVENEAYHALQAALEREAFLYLHKQGHHRLPFKEYQRAHALGIRLPESEPVYRVGLLHTDMLPEPVEVIMPKGHPLARCYRLANTKDRADSDEANLHLLAALGQFDTAFVPVEINSAYDGYSWAKLPMIGKVTVTAGKTRQESLLWSGQLACVESLTLTARCSDGRRFSAPVCMAVKPPSSDPSQGWDPTVYVTPAARGALTSEQIWYHLGGFSDQGDSYDTQEDQVHRELADFWLRLDGPYESLRRRLLEATADLPQGWQHVTIRPEGQIVIGQADGREEVFAPPA